MRELSEDEDESLVADDAALAHDASIIEIVDGLISDAVSMKASDIHVEPHAEALHVRCRIDGVLHKLREFPTEVQAGIVSRIKIMGNMDIAERRMPQDGRTSFETSDGKAVDLRLASVPTLHGENVSIRILEVSPLLPTLDSLGLTGPSLERFEGRSAGRRGASSSAGRRAAASPPPSTPVSRRSTRRREDLHGRGPCRARVIPGSCSPRSGRSSE